MNPQTQIGTGKKILTHAAGHLVFYSVRHTQKHECRVKLMLWSREFSQLKVVQLFDMMDEEDHHFEPGKPFCQPFYMINDWLSHFL